MKLYTNGCSFTHGHDPFHCYEFTQSHKGLIYKSERYDYAWPWQLSKYFDYTFNHARYGTGMDRTLRTTLQFINSIPDDEFSKWIFVIQASQPSRKEYLHPNREVYGQIAPPGLSNQIGDMGQQYRSLQNDDIHLVNYGNDKLSDLSMEFYLEWESNVALAINQVKNLIVLQDVFKSKGIKYLFTSMMKNHVTLNDQGYRDSELLENLSKHLDQNFIVSSIEEMMEGLSKKSHNDIDEHGSMHPNEKGHNIIAKKLKNEMEKRNWLT